MMADVLDYHGVFLRVDRKHAPALARVFPAITLTLSPCEPEWCAVRSFVSQCHGLPNLRTSETIFVNFFSRNSRATGPNTRVPTGSPAIVDQHRGVVVEPDVRCHPCAAVPFASAPPPLSQHFPF